VTYANRKFVQNRRLSQAETAALTSAVLERARQALHESQTRTGLELPPRKLRLSAGSGRRSGSMVASSIGRHFEYIVMASCLIVTGTAWMVHWAT
jgi:hypothetical protein